MTNEINKDVTEYLDYYSDPSRELDFAVLVKGPWGSGKTFLVNTFLASKGIKPLYVSLYGLTSTGQIDEEFYRQLHPVLSSKGMRIAGAVARAALKGTLKLDFNGDGKDDGSLNVSLPQLDLAKALGKPSERLLVFDDLERCKMSITEVLGYINSFVEHDGLKAVLLAHEDEIAETKEQRYRDVKEKLIGQTLTIEAPAPPAYDAFLSTIQDPSTAKFLARHKEDVLDLHRAGGRNNLRLLKQSLWDFERIGRHLTEWHWANDKAILKVLNAVLALAIEHRAGHLEPGQITRLIGNRIGRMLRSHASGEESPDAVIEKRYPMVDFDDTIVDAGLIEAALVRGEADGDKIRASLDSSADYASSDQPLWLRAWNAYHSDDETAEAVAEELEAAFLKREFTIVGEILHVFGLRFWFARISLLQKTNDALVAEGVAYVDDLVATGRLPSALDENPRLDASRSFAGKGIRWRRRPSSVSLPDISPRRLRRSRTANIFQLRSAC